MIGPVWSALLGLLGAAALGAIASGAATLGERDTAIGVLNALGIRIAFPALVVASLLRAPSAEGRWAAWTVGPAAVAIALGLVALARRGSARVRAEAGPIALVVAFGNVAYLGMPLATAVLGEAEASTAALAATAHSALAAIAGPVLLRRFGGAPSASSLGRALAQPLFLAVPIGITLRWAPELAREAVLAVVGPIGAVAAPVGAFVVGAYFERHRARLFRFEPGVALAAAARLLLVPALAVALATPLVAQGAMRHIDAQLAVLLAAMPAAVSTFAIAHDEGLGAERAAGAIVVSSALSVLTVPVWLAVVP